MPLPLQNFITAQTVVTAAWLNQVDALSHIMTADTNGRVTLAPSAAGPNFSISNLPGSMAAFLVSGTDPGAALDGYFVSNLAPTGLTQGLVVGNDTVNTLNIGKSGSAAAALFTGAPAGDLSWIQSGSATPLAIVTGVIARALFATTATIQPSVAPPAGGSLQCGLLISSTANLGFFFGTGAPTFAAAEGSIYSNITGGAGARLYVNTNGATTWVPATSP